MTSEIYTTDILDKEHFWTEELMKVNQDFLFGCSTGVWGRGKCFVPMPSPSTWLPRSILRRESPPTNPGPSETVS